MRTRLALIVAALPAVAVLPAAAAVIQVPGDQPTIAAAVAAAGENDEIVVGVGTWSESLDLDAAAVPQVLTLRGAGMFDTVWDAGGVGPCLRVAGAAGTSWTVRDLGFTGSVGAAAAAVDVADGGGGAWTFTDCRFFLTDEDMLRSQADLTVTGCVFGDADGPQVGALYLTGGAASLTNCTFDNLFRAAAVVAPAAAAFDHCIFSNLDSDGLNFGATVSVSCSCRFAVASTGGGWPTGTDMLAADPEFCGAVGQRDWSLQSDSPCLADPVCGPIGARGQGCGLVDSEALNWGDLKARYR